MTGDTGVEIASGSLVYQLLLAQIVHDKKESFNGVADQLNDHPLRKIESWPATSDDEQAKSFYNSLLNHYNIPDERTLSKHGVPKRNTLLAETLYQRYSQTVLDDIADCEQKFNVLYDELDKTLSK